MSVQAISAQSHAVAQTRTPQANSEARETSEHDNDSDDKKVQAAPTAARPHQGSVVDIVA